MGIFYYIIDPADDGRFFWMLMLDDAIIAESSHYFKNEKGAKQNLKTKIKDLKKQLANMENEL